MTDDTCVNPAHRDPHVWVQSECRPPLDKSLVDTVAQAIASVEEWAGWMPAQGEAAIYALMALGWTPPTLEGPA